MPKEFYSYLQKLGINLEHAYNLYNLKLEDNRLNIYCIASKEGSWPLVVEKDKLL